MEILVTQDNIQQLMLGIVEQYQEKLKTNKIAAADNAISNILDLTVSGTGSKILSNNGSYKESKKSDIDDLMSKFHIIQNVMTISKDGQNYKVTFPEYSEMQLIVDKILTTGTGNKLYTNNGEYIEKLQINPMNTTDITNMINQIKDGE